MENYKPNSHRSKEEQKQKEREKPKKVVKGNVKTKKKSEIRKAVDGFISEDVENIKSYVVRDVLIPTIKDTIWNVLTNSLDMILGGHGSRTGAKRSGSKVSYRNYYDQRDRYSSRSDEPKSRSRFDYDEIKFEYRGDAEAVLDQMQDIIDEYDFVTVLDLYDMVDLTAPHTANNYGWTSLRNAEVIRTRDGYGLKLPRALSIK